MDEEAQPADRQPHQHLTTQFFTARMPFPALSVGRQEWWGTGVVICLQQGADLVSFPFSFSLTKIAPPALISSPVGWRRWVPPAVGANRLAVFYDTWRLAGGGASWAGQPGWSVCVRLQPVPRAPAPQHRDRSIRCLQPA